jgi:hypothetical protein
VGRTLAECKGDGDACGEECDQHSHRNRYAT